MSSDTNGGHHELVIRRENLQQRLGIRLASATSDDPPVVKALAGIASDSDLRIGDIVLKIDGEEARNSVVATVLFGKAGTEVHLTVRRPGGTAAVGSKKIVIARNSLGLGLVVDASNTITELVPKSAAAEHGAVAVGQRVVAVNGELLPPGTPLAPYIPPGNAPFELTVVEPTGAAPPTPQARGPMTGGVPLPGGSSVRSLEASSASAAAKPLGKRAAYDARRSPFGPDELEELRRAFVALGGGPNAEGKIGPAAVLAFLSHFAPDASLNQAAEMCSRASADGGVSVSLVEFYGLAFELATSLGPSHALAETLDPDAVGFVGRAEAQSAIRALAAAGGAPPTPSDVAAMLAMLRPGDDGLVHRETAVAALHAALKV